MTTRRRSLTVRRPLTIRNTSVYDTTDVKRLVREAFKALGAETRAVCVNVKNSRRGLHGRAYNDVPDISNAPPTAKYLITLGLGPPDNFPRWHQGYSPPVYINGGPDVPPPLRQSFEPGLRRWPLIVCPSWEHGVVYLAAHEIQHIVQFRYGLTMSEVSCEWAAHRALNEIFG